MSADLYGGKGSVSILSNQGLVVADSKRPEFIGQSLKGLLPGTGKRCWRMCKKARETAGSIRTPRKSKYRCRSIWAHRQAVGDFDPSAQGGGHEPGLGPGAGTAVTRRQEQHLAGLGRRRCLLAGIAGAVVCHSGKYVGPIREAAALAANISLGDFSRRLVQKSDDEVGQLSFALNDMSESLQRQVRVAERISEGDLDLEVRCCPPPTTPSANRWKKWSVT